MNEDEWLTLYIILFFVAFISGLALLAARSQRRRQNAYKPWHARLAAAKGKPGHDGNIVSKTSTGWVSGVLLSVVALAAIVAWAIFFWSSSSDPQVSATLRDIQAAQQQTTSGTKAINDSNPAEDQLAHDNASVAEQLKDLTHRDNAELAERLNEKAQMARDKASVESKAVTHRRARDKAAAEKLEESREHMAGAFAKASEETLRPQTPLPQPSATPAIPKRRQIVMRNWF